MVTTRSSFFWLLWKLIVLSLFLSPFIGSSYGLDELFHDYDSPQGLSMGNAFTADAKGHVANYYNPAGLAKDFKRNWEVVPFAFDAVLSGTAFGSILRRRSLGLSRMFADLAAHPGSYSYDRFNLMPALARRNFAVTFLASYWSAARSDGTNLDVNAGYDVGPSVGWGINLAGNTLKFGVSVRAFIRNQLKGVLTHASLATDDAIKSQMKEGYGFGVNVGVMVTLPLKYLPSAAVVVKDALDTQFFASKFINTKSTAAPDRVNRSYHFALSIHPALGKGFRSTVSVEMKNIELVIDGDWKKLIHAGFQLETDRNFYFWLGANQLYPTAGLGWRVSGGDLEVGSYAQDVGTGKAREANRRFYLRYTIDF